MKVRKEVDVTLLVLFLIIVLSFSLYLEGKMRHVDAIPARPVLPMMEIDADTPSNISLSPLVDHVVVINRTRFEPAELHISVGEKVTWKNDDPRRVYRIYEQEVDSRFNPFLDVDGSFSFVFNETGTYSIRDATFKNMQGTVIVE